jgi:hypothetical protein
MTEQIAKIASMDSPGLLQVAVENSDLESELEKLRTDRGFSVCFLDGSKMRTISGVFEEFARGLNFPDYFGHNSGAFDECLTDLSWIDTNGFCVVILTADQLLADQSGEVSWLLESLNDACEEWSEAVEQGEDWDRPALPFRVLFQASGDGIGNLPEGIATLPLLV